MTVSISVAILPEVLYVVLPVAYGEVVVAVPDVKVVIVSVVEWPADVVLAGVSDRPLVVPVVVPIVVLSVVVVVVAVVFVFLVVDDDVAVKTEVAVAVVIEETAMISTIVNNVAIDVSDVILIDVILVEVGKKVNLLGVVVIVVDVVLAVVVVVVVVMGAVVFLS